MRAGLFYVYFSAHMNHDYRPQRIGDQSFSLSFCFVKQQQLELPLVYRLSQGAYILRNERSAEVMEDNSFKRKFDNFSVRY